MQSFKLKFLGVTILQGVEFPIFLLIFEWALQQCSATALPVIQLHSADSFQLLTQRTNTVKFGLRAFCSSGSASWNTLPAHLRLPSLTLDCFRKHLRRYLFEVFSAELELLLRAHL